MEKMSAEEFLSQFGDQSNWTVDSEYAAKALVGLSLDGVSVDWLPLGKFEFLISVDEGAWLTEVYNAYASQWRKIRGAVAEWQNKAGNYSERSLRITVLCCAF